MAGATVGKNVEIVSSARIITPHLEIGDNSFIGHECLLIAAHGSRIQIGNHVDLGPRCTLVTGTHAIGGPEHRAGPGEAHDITIEDGVWAGAGVTILAGVRVGRRRGLPRRGAERPHRRESSPCHPAACVSRCKSSTSVHSTGRPKQSWVSNLVSGSLVPKRGLQAPVRPEVQICKDEFEIPASTVV